MFLVPIGGGNEIGASCYYLNLDGVNILLDCGVRYGQLPYPDYQYLTKNYIDGLWELDMIFISHAHYDHIGSFPYVASRANRASVYSTLATKKLTNLQLYLFKKGLPNLFSTSFNHLKELEILNAIDVMNPIPYLKSFKYKNLSFQIFDAGHVPGAAMILIEKDGKKILYTGDFSDKDYLITTSYNIPTDLKVDILIVSGTYLNKSGGNKHDFNDLINEMNCKLREGFNIVLNYRHLTKGIELIKLLDKNIEKGNLYPCKVYLDESVCNVVDVYEDLDYCVYSRNVQPISSINVNEPYVIVSDDTHSQMVQYLQGYSNIYKMHTDYSLHCSTKGLHEFINRLSPEKVFVVHYEDDMKFHSEFIYTENKILYKL